jgi:hypothetical protein
MQQPKYIIQICTLIKKSGITEIYPCKIGFLTRTFLHGIIWLNSWNTFMVLHDLGTTVLALWLCLSKLIYGLQVHDLKAEFHFAECSRVLEVWMHEVT